MNKKQRLRKKRIKIMLRKIKKFTRSSLYLSYTKWCNNDNVITFKDKNISCELKNELPNEKLRAEYRQCILKKLYLNEVMSRSAYYTLKGMNKRHNNDGIINVLNFIKKHDIEAYNSYYDYISTPQPIMYCSYKYSSLVKYGSVSVYIVK